MKKIWKYFLMLISMNVNAQNLVPNPSFEDTVACPSMLGLINNSIGWNSFRESPDYFNSCAPNAGFSNPSVPVNSWGYQYPRTGNAYAGVTTFSILSANWREFTGIQLTQALSIGQSYFASFYISRAVNNINHMNIASSKIGMLMSTVEFSSINPAPVGNFAHVYSDTLISDTSNWVLISGFFLADSAYQYLIIGNFFNDSLTNHVVFDSSATYAFYYVEDILVMDSTTTGINQDYAAWSDRILLNLFQNEMTIGGNDIKTISIFDATGRKCIEQAAASSLNRINVSSLSSGIYFIQVCTSGNSFVRKIIKQ
jgi:hypothetical protein